MPINISIPDSTHSCELAAYLQEAAKECDHQKLIEVCKVLRGKDGKSHTKNCENALKALNMPLVKKLF